MPEAQSEFDPAELALADQAAQLPPPPPSEMNWTQVWQIPVLLLGLGLFVLGIYLAIPRYNPPDLPAALDSIEQQLAVNELDAAVADIDTIRDDEYFKQLPESAAIHGRLAQLRADWRFLSIRQQPFVDFSTEASRQNNSLIAADYADAERREWIVPPDSMRRYAETLALLERTEEALALVDRLPPSAAQQRARIVRTLLEADHGPPTTQSIPRRNQLLSRFEQEVRGITDSDARLQQEIWAAARKARQFLHPTINTPQRAIQLLTPTIIRLAARVPDPSKPVALAGLHTLLADAYLAVDDFKEAGIKYRFAQSLVPAADPLNARILIGLGQIALAQGAAADEALREQAVGYFTEAARRHPTSPVYPDALLGLADAYAWAPGGRQLPEALEHLNLAISTLLEQSPPWDPRRTRAAELAQQHAERAAEEERYPDTLSLLKLAARLEYPELSPDTLKGFASVHEKIGKQTLEQAQELDPANLQPGEDSTAQAFALANQDAARHFEQAGDFYLRLAAAVTGLPNEDTLHGNALWNAAQNFDRAQDWPKAITTYADFVETRREDDRRVRAKLNLGLALMADRQYDPAVQRFEELIRNHPAAPYVTDAYVPLARSLQALDRFNEAERILLSVVTDHPTITPDSDAYRDALIDLGSLYHAQGSNPTTNQPAAYARAIERLAEAVERYGNSRKGPRLRFLLADALRRSVDEIDAELATELPPRRQLALQAERDRRLQEARAYFNQVKTELEERHPDTLSNLERLYHRNSYFYEADAMYTLGGVQPLETAIELYSRAASRWASHPSALIAQVQIVNAYCRLEQYESAAAAHRKAMYLLRRIPEEAFDDQTMPMSRDLMEEWLQWSARLNTLAATPTP
ncbi:MAG: tetratricopeptide repeat protein [Planctomycetota bacterium]